GGASHLRDSQPVDLEPLPPQASHRQQSLEHLGEADEQRALDHAHQLALERLVPAPAVELLLEQEGQADVVAAPLDARGLALALAAHDTLVLEQLRVVRRALGRAHQAQQRAVHHQVGVATDGGGEVTVRGAGQARVAEVAGVVARPLQRPQPAPATYWVTRSLMRAACAAACAGVCRSGNAGVGTSSSVRRAESSATASGAGASCSAAATASTTRPSAKVNSTSWESMRAAPRAKRASRSRPDRSRASRSASSRSSAAGSCPASIRSTCG